MSQLASLLVCLISTSKNRTRDRLGLAEGSFDPCARDRSRGMSQLVSMIIITSVEWDEEPRGSELRSCHRWCTLSQAPGCIFAGVMCNTVWDNDRCRLLRDSLD